MKVTALEIRKILNKTLQIALPLALGLAVFLWTYHGFDFKKACDVLFERMDYKWMILSLFFGIGGELFRGWRWTLALYPLGEFPKRSNSVYAVFVSYAANLVIPRIGEVSRCAILSKYDNVSFSKSLGTVLTERLIDMGCVGMITVCTLLWQMNIFSDFFRQTGTDSGFFCRFRMFSGVAE